MCFRNDDAEGLYFVTVPFPGHLHLVFSAWIIFPTLETMSMTVADKLIIKNRKITLTINISH